MDGHNNISHEPSLHTKQPQLSQSLFKGVVLQSSDHPYGPSLEHL